MATSLLLKWWPFRILIKMVQDPPRQVVRIMEQPEWHPYTRSMTLRRFQQIRAVFHANDNTKWLVLMTLVQSSSCFELFENWPFLPILMLGWAGPDEASVSSAQILWFFNFLQPN
jgi:hypothetical protein